MLDLGWSEMAVIALLALIVIGPRDMPEVMRTVGRYVRRARKYMREFQNSLEDMMHESELDEARDTVQRARTFEPDKEIENVVDPDRQVRDAADAVEREARTDDAQTASRTAGETEGGTSSPGEDTDEAAYGRSGGGEADTRGTTNDDRGSSA